MPITRISVDNPVFATMMMVALVVLGLFSYQRLGVDQFPDIDFPLVVVSTEYPGASPEAVESDVTRKVEEAVNTIAGIKTLTSRSYEGRSVVIAEFDLQTESQVAVQDVREKVAALRPLFRDEVEEPQISRFDPDDQPIMSIAVNSDIRTLRDLTTITDQIILKRLENVRGVGRAVIAGGVKRQIHIHLKPERLQALGIGVDAVIGMVRGENQNLPAGNVSRGQDDRVIQVDGRVDDSREFLDLIVARRGGAPVRLGEVADVVDGEQEKDSVALLNGRPALAVDVVKVQGANTIEVATGIKAAVAELQISGLPADIRLDIVRDSSRGITNSVNNVRHTLIEGGALTVLIVLLFLSSWRSTVITGLTLPVAVIGTFSVLLFFGYTLNVMTLMALSLAIGILIDDAIVVRENITRHLAMGKGHRQAALDGTQEIALAVLATTLTIVAVFLPVAFMGGIIGRFFLQFGITVSAAVLISLFVSFTLDPMLSSKWYDPAAHGIRSGGVFGRLGAGFEHGFDRFARGYGAVLRWALRHSLIVIGVAVASFIGSFFLVKVISVEFVPEADLGEQVVEVEAPVGSSLDYTTVKLRQAEAALSEFPEVAYTYATVNTGVALGKNRGSIYVKLIPIDQRTRTPSQLAGPIRERLAAIPGITVSIGIPGAMGIQKPIQVSVQGIDIAELDRIAGQVKAAMQRIPGFVDVDTSLKAAKPTLSVRLNRDIASDLGIGTAQVADTLRPLFAGDTISSWKAPDGENYDVVVRLPEADRKGRDDLDRIYLTGTAGSADGAPRMVPLGQVVRIETTLGASQINRRDLRREVNVMANVSGRAVGDVGKELQKAIAGIDLPTGYRIVFGGSTKDIAETSGFAASALMLAVILIYLILASQFGSFLQPLAIMMSLPLSLVGVFLGLLVTGSTLNIFSAIGFIMLMGLVTKNAILLVDFANQAHRRGQDLHSAIVAAGTVRLRPIVMTTMAMIFGMLPLALGLGEGAQQRAPMAHAVIGGLISSTLLTLVVVPVILTFLEGLSVRLRRRRIAVPEASGAPAE
jgi:HAE1 family hydrophobic/amphiphilic exporter-1